MIDRFLKEIGTDYLDLVLLHCVESAKWPDELRKQMDIMARYKQKGAIRAHGVSCHTLAALEAAADEPWVDSVHARINPYGMSMDGPPEKVAPVLKKLHRAGKGVVGMKIIGEDYIAKAFEFAHEADPSAELYYNDYSLENEAKRRGALELIKKLLATQQVSLVSTQTLFLAVTQRKLRKTG